MRIKTIIVVLITVMLTIVLTQNTEPVTFSFLWASFRISKLVMMTAVSVVAFILGILVGKPSKVKRLGGTFIEGEHQRDNPNTLSDEDKEYIN